jgi:hypothetical protein
MCSNEGKICLKLDKILGHGQIAFRRSAFVRRLGRWVTVAKAMNPITHVGRSPWILLFAATHTKGREVSLWRVRM